MSTRAPAGLKTAGRKLWKAMTSEFELGPHELLLLEESCHVVDACVELRELAEAAEGVEKRRTWAELRGQQAVLARLIAALRVPEPEEGPAKQPVGALAQLRANAAGRGVR